ncbi:acyltransferase family protein [Sphingomonas solaris]|uniref:AMP-binding protein n=1 Tax=Alterirhizorhabdus solaris TaxID=2529389 RepID=A0A558QVU4_9SPHN|nr:acyltransferase family protein [Sphingomonas solaris]TVV71260.1 AMP-binding protein [Sphingomonas solaris]
MPLDPQADVPDGITVGRRVVCAPGGGWLSPRMTPRHDDSPAQVTLTSGTTGRPKPILLSHRALGDVTDRLIAAQGLTGEVREYVGVPITFSFGLGRVRAVAAVRGACFLPERGFRVDELAAMLTRGDVNALSAVPTLLRLAIAQADRLREAGEKLRWLEIGSQAMSVAEKLAVREIFPNARIIQHYGLTEASRSTFLDISAAEPAALESVGNPNGAVEIRTTDEGLVAIRGPHVADGIVTPEGVVPLTDPDGWLVTRDLGRIEAGRLLFEGRADHLVNVGGIKVPGELFEERLLARLPADTPLAVAAGHDPLRGEIVIVAHEGAEQPGWRTAVEETAAAFGIGDGTALFMVDSLPRTDTGKLRRHEITALFAAAAPQAAARQPVPKIDADSPGEGVLATFAAVFGTARREESASFHALGGDSLNYVSMLVGLERFVRDLPEDWDTLSIGTLSTLANEQARSSTVAAAPRRVLPKSLDSVRGLACILIVALHVVGLSPWEGLKLADESVWHQAMDALNLVRLPLFTALSGFLYGAMPAIRSGFGPFMARKLHQLLIPLIFATFAFWALRNIAKPQGDSLFWAYVDGYQHLWFIDALLLIFALVAAADTLAPEKARNAVIAAVLLGGVIAYPLIPSVPVLHIKNAVFLLPFFAWGLLLYRLPALLGSRGLLVVAVIVAAALLVSQQLSPGREGLLGTYGWLRWVCGGAIVLALLRLFPKSVWLERIAAYSFTIYLWHPAANGAVRAVMMKLGLHATWPLFLIGLAAGIAGPIALHLVMLRLPKALSLPVIGR